MPFEGLEKKHEKDLRSKRQRWLFNGPLKLLGFVKATEKGEPKGKIRAI